MHHLHSIFQRIKEDGFRLTTIRKAMVTLFAGEKKPLTAADVRDRLSAIDIEADRTTVYRELLFLSEHGVIRKIQFGDHKMRYEICAEHHHHLICTKCKEVTKIILGQHLERQEKKIYRKERFMVTSHSLEFYGVCCKCR